MRNSRRLGIFGTAATGVATLVLAAHAAFAPPTAPYYEKPGTVRTCGVNGIAGIGGVQVSYGGSGSFQTLFNSEKYPASTTLSAVGFEGRGQDPKLGEVRLNFVPIKETSTITANQDDTPLPATGTLRFNVNLTISSQPKAVYRSDSPVEMINTDIREWPQQNAQYKQTHPIKLTNIYNPKQTIEISSAVATLNGQ